MEQDGMTECYKLLQYLGSGLIGVLRINKGPRTKKPRLYLSV